MMGALFRSEVPPLASFAGGAGRELGKGNRRVMKLVCSLNEFHVSMRGKEGSVQEHLNTVRGGCMGAQDTRTIKCERGRDRDLDHVDSVQRQAGREGWERGECSLQPGKEQKRTRRPTEKG